MEMIMLKKYPEVGNMQEECRIVYHFNKKETSEYPSDVMK